MGAEVHPGEGIIGVAAQARIPVRISHATSEFGYGRAMREDVQSRGITADTGMFSSTSMNAL